MVYLSQIYTRSGDSGETGLGDGTRVRKDALRVSAYGEVDELNAVFGLIAAYCPDYAEFDLVRRIQNDLFDLGADLCVPPPGGGAADPGLRIVAKQAEDLENAIDRVNAPLAPLTSFILPGGGPAAAWLHLARTVCRRAERTLVSLMAVEPVNSQALVYLNRLSDLLFVLSRAANGAAGDVLWVPGGGR